MTGENAIFWPHYVVGAPNGTSIQADMEKMSNVFDKSWEPAMSVTVFLSVTVSVFVFLTMFVTGNLGTGKNYKNLKNLKF